MIEKQSVMLWIGGAPNQQALACRIAANVPVSDIVVERRESQRKRRSVGQQLQRLLGRTVFRSISSAWRQTQDHYSKSFPALPVANILEVQDIHSPEAQDFIRSSKAELVAVSGTRMIRSSMLNESSHRQILNLHTGLSPFVKGGPNCTNWCITEKNWHLIGNTVMWIDGGIDSGDLVTTETVPFQGTESLPELHLKVMDHSHALYVRSINAVWAGCPIPRVKQEHVGAGVTYYSRQWNAINKARMLLNWRHFEAEINSKEVCLLRDAVKTVSLDAA